VTERRPFLSGFVDLILDDDEIVVMSAPVTTIVGQRFADHVRSLIPKSGWINFRLGQSVYVGPEQKAFLDALMHIWPYCDELEPELAAIANGLLHEFIRMLKTRAPGAITQVLADSGLVFGPVPT